MNKMLTAQNQQINPPPPAEEEGDPSQMVYKKVILTRKGSKTLNYK
jgi:hypothetical protein